MINIQLLSQLKTLLIDQGFVVTDNPFIATRSTGRATYCVIQKLVHAETGNEALALEACQHDGTTMMGIMEDLTQTEHLDAVTDFTANFIKTSQLFA